MSALETGVTRNRETALVFPIVRLQNNAHVYMELVCAFGHDQGDLVADIEIGAASV